MRLAIIIVSYNTRDLLRGCLRSVTEAVQTTGLAATTLVVDNASHDDSAAMTAREFPHVRLTALERNIGFTRANNLALSQLGFDPGPRTPAADAISLIPQDERLPEYVLFLNPDTEVAPDSLATLIDFMDAMPEAGACGPALRYADGAFQQGAFRFPDLVQIWLDLFPLRGVPGAHRLHASRLNGRYPAAQWAGTQPFLVDFVLGAALLARGAALEQIGGLDEGYFMYCEEMDWCLRLQEAGWDTFAVPTAEIIHHAGQSSRQTRWPAFVELWRSRLRFCGKYAERYPLWRLWLTRGLLRTGLRLRSRTVRRRFAQGQIDGLAAGEELAAYRVIREL